MTRSRSVEVPSMVVRKAVVAGCAAIWLGAVLGAVARGQAVGEAASAAGVAPPTTTTAGAESEARANAAVHGLRINELQLIGTHNSYHLAPDPFALQAIAAVAPEEARAIDCSQRPLIEQLDTLGLRHFELDCYLDPEGGMFQDPLVLRLARAAGSDVPPFDPTAELAAPGIKVLHSPDFDVRTTQYTLRGALAEIKAWSDRHPEHVPVFLLMELKGDSFSPLRPVPWGPEGFDELHGTIREIWPRPRILTPRDVQGDAPTLREAVLGQGWPLVDEHRGKVAFLLDNEGSLRDRYLESTADDRLLFVSVDRDHPAAAWMKRNDPESQAEEIRGLVDDGFLVRTRTDSGTREARADDHRRRDLAIASGAQLISTDFPEPDKRFSAYCVRLPPPPEPSSSGVELVTPLLEPASRPPPP